MDEAAFKARVAAKRRFNRYITRWLGLLRETVLDTPFTLTEVRVMFEIAMHENVTAAQLRRDLGLEAGFLSRVLRKLRSIEMIAASASEDDGRRKLLLLTDSGRRAYDLLAARVTALNEARLSTIGEAEQVRVIAAMNEIQFLFERTKAPGPVNLRAPRPGDFGWIVSRHGALYAQDYGWNGEFELLVAGIVGDFARKHDPARERVWMADVDGVTAGSVMLVDAGGDVAKLRLLIVEPWARGLGVGGKLVDACIETARTIGYRRMTLWTNANLTEARAMYLKRGFVLTASEPHHSFGADLVGETFERDL